MMNRNKMILGGLLVPAFALASAAAIFSQQPAGGTMIYQREPAIQEPGSAPRTPRPDDDTFFYVTSEMSFDGKLVKGAPYSAQAVTEMTQTLSDGNRIVNKSTASIYRDSEGRTRREQTLRAIGPFATTGESPQTIFINDPVTGVSYTLDTRTHVARKMQSFHWEYKTAGPDGSERASVTTVTARSSERGEGKGEGKGEGWAFSIPRTPEGDVGFAIAGRADSKQVKNESLGNEKIEGVEAEGRRTTITIAAGVIGNERPIEIVDERWYSPALQTVVRSRHSDPRFGETIYRLTNIDRSEPDKSLFEVPADYTIKGGGAGVGYGVGAASGGGAGVSGGTSGAGSSISGGMLNGKAINLPPPEYPPLARQAGASGSVKVQVTIDEEGNVISAKAVSGHPLLQAAAVSAAQQAKFAPTRLSGQPVKVNGVLIYNFVAQ
jgi:TonB family protein